MELQASLIDLRWTKLALENFLRIVDIQLYESTQLLGLSLHGFKSRLISVYALKSPLDRRHLLGVYLTLLYGYLSVSDSLLEHVVARLDT